MNEQASTAIHVAENPPADTPAQPTATASTADFDAIRLEDMPGNIRVCEQNIRLNGWVLGGMLVSAKKRLPHGTFMDWLKTHTDLSQTTANNLMSLHSGVQQTPFLAEMNQSAAVLLLALSPAQREQYAAEHDVQAISVRQLREDMERLKQEASRSQDALQATETAHQEELKRLTAIAQGELAQKAQEAAAAQRAASNANGLYEKLNDQYAEAQERIAMLEQSLSDAPTTITTVEVERMVEVLPPDYEQLQAELREATETADRLEADLRRVRADLLRESAQEKGDSGGLAGFRQAAADFLARGYLLTAIGAAANLKDDGERGETLRCIRAVEELCEKARKAIETAPLPCRAADAQVE